MFPAGHLTFKHGQTLDRFAPHPNVYGLSKAALEHLVRFSAGQLAKGDNPIRVYGIAPTIYESEMVDKILDSV